MKKASLFVILCLSALAAFGQTSIYLGGGPSIYSATAPHIAGNLTFGICTSSAGTCSLTSLEARGGAANPAELVYSTQTGIKQRIATVSANAFSTELFTVAQAGASVTTSATSGIAGLGGGLLFRPTKWPNWSLAASMRAIYSPANPGWQPWGGFHIGYTFRNATLANAGAVAGQK